MKAITEHTTNGVSASYTAVPAKSLLEKIAQMPPAIKTPEPDLNQASEQLRLHLLSENSYVVQSLLNLREQTHALLGELGQRLTLFESRLVTQSALSRIGFLQDPTAQDSPVHQSLLRKIQMASPYAADDAPLTLSQLGSFTQTYNHCTSLLRTFTAQLANLQDLSPVQKTKTKIQIHKILSLLQQITGVLGTTPNKCLVRTPHKNVTENLNGICIRLQKEVSIKYLPKSTLDRLPKIQEEPFYQ